VELRTYRAPTVADALLRIKRELGPDAVILNTRTIRTGGVLGLRRRRAIEITASAEPRGAPARRATTDPPAPTDREPRLAALARARRAYGIAPAPRAVAVGGPSDDSEPAGASPGSRDQTARDAAREVAGAVVAAGGVEAPRPDDLRDELASIKRLVGQVIRTTGGAAAPALPDALVAMYMRLIESEVAAEIADGVVDTVRRELAPAELDDPDTVRQCVLAHLARLIPVAPEADDAPTGGRGGPRTIALVGPTGVGKTTTIAKLAAEYKLRRGRRVGLVTCDTYRIAAVEQLRTYANIIGVPLKVALTPAEMASSCRALDSCDVVLIDTAGRSQHDGGKLEELGALLRAADPDETHLVLSGSAGQGVLMRAAERFAVARPDRVILSKLDEAVSFGVLVNVAHRVGAAVSYLTTGQEVPDHIEPGGAERLASLVLDGGPVR